MKQKLKQRVAKLTLMHNELVLMGWQPTCKGRHLIEWRSPEGQPHTVLGGRTDKTTPRAWRMAHDWTTEPYVRVQMYNYP